MPSKYQVGVRRRSWSWRARERESRSWQRCFGRTQATIYKLAEAGVGRSWRGAGDSALRGKWS